MKVPLLETLETLAMGRRAVGVDLGTRSVKVAVLEGWGERVRVKGLYLAEVCGGDVAQSLRSLLDEKSIRGDVVVSSIPSMLLTLRQMGLPFKGRKKIGQVIKYEIEPFLPYPVDQVVADFTVTEETDEGSQLLVAAANRERVRAHIEKVSSAGVEPAVVDVDALLLFEAGLRFGQPGGEGVTLLAEIGATKTVLCVTGGDRYLLSRSIPVGGDAFTKAFSEALGISAEEAERLKREGGFEAFPGGLPGPVSDVLSRLEREIEVTVHSVAAQAGTEHLDRILLSGGGALLKGLDGRLSEAFGCTVRPLDPLSGLSFSGEDCPVPQRMTVAVSAALRGVRPPPVGVNLRRDDLAYRGGLTGLKKPLLTTAGLICVILATLVVSFTVRYVSLVREDARIQKRMGEAFHQAFPGKKIPPGAMPDYLRNEEEKIRKEYESFEILAAGALSSLDILNDLTHRMPKDAKIQVTDLDIRQDQVKMRGITDKIGSGDKLVKSLKASPYFGEPGPPNIVGKKDYFEFNLTVPIIRGSL